MLRWHSLGEADLPVGHAWLSPLETERLSKMRFTKRRSEWLLARWTAKQALAKSLNFGDDVGSLGRIEIRTIIGGPAQGAPEVFVDGSPAAVGMSSTDRAGWAVCMVSDRLDIGCDLELVEPRSEGFVRDFLTTSEQEAVAHPPFEGSADLMANLIWSSKESALKVLRTGLRRDTRSVAVSFPAGAPWHGWLPLLVRAEEGTEFRGWWQRYRSFLVTVVAASDLPPPCALVQPPGLAAAEPTHRWMATPLVLAPD